MRALSESGADYFPYICVREPYFALDGVRMIAPGTVEGGVPIQQPLGFEAGPISAGEVGRHLAILGLCAASTVNPRKERHYYLAGEAYLTRNPHLTPLSMASPLRATARASMHGPRNASAVAELSTERGQVVCTLEVSYYVIAEKIFRKLFDAHRHEFQPPLYNPYARYVPLRTIDISRDQAICGLDPIEPQQCAGHFSGYPALPVAILGSKMIEAAGRFFHKRMGADEAPYKVNTCHIKAENLAFAGESVAMTVTHRAKLGAAEQFYCSATSSSGKSVGEMLVELMV